MTMILVQQQVQCAAQPEEQQLQGGSASSSGAWDLWTAEQIASASSCPVENVQKFWPLLWQELDARQISDRNVCAAVIGTVAVETASTFCPVREAYFVFDDEREALRRGDPTFINPDNEEWRRTHLQTSRYFPFYGRGFIQLTWNGPDIWNYQTYGQDVGKDLAANPDHALLPEVAAAVMACFFVRQGVVDAARQSDWTLVRKRVQGGTDGLPHLLQVIGALGL
jgi:hypothetical protein